MTSSPCFATLYEEWLVKYKQHSKYSGNGVNTEREKASIDQALTIQAARMVPLLADVNLSPLFVHHILLEIDRDTSSLLLQSMDSFQNMTLGDENNEHDQTDNDVDDTDNADAFFDIYPECIRDEGDVSDDEDEEICIDAVPIALSSFPHNEMLSHHRGPPIPSESPSPARPRNPYASQQRQTLVPPLSRGAMEVLPPQQHHRPQDAIEQSRHRPALDLQNWNTARNTSRDQSTWDAIPNTHNPFQSAAQFRYHGTDENDLREEENRKQSVTSSHPYASKPPEYAQAPPPQKNIPDSLKRKFQPPKKTQDGSRKRGLGGGQALHPSVRSSDKDSSADDDDLPEALRGLDKELIEKIENEILDSGETVTFDDIAGLEHAKATVQELVCWPMKRPDLFTGLRRGPNGLLLYGPPGTGKTLIGKAVAYESGATFFSISSSSLTSKWIGEGEKLVRTLFAVAVYREPAVVFIDEIDSLLTQRKSDENEASRRIKTEFLVQLDGTGGCKGRVLVIGATNRPHELDDAARRRFVKRLYIPLPAVLDRESLIRTLLGKNQHSLTNACISKLALATDGFSGADLKALCVEAAMGPLRELGVHALQVDAKDVPHIAYKHFRQALRGMNPSVSQADLEVYVEWTRTYGSLRANPADLADDSDDE